MGCPSAGSSSSWRARQVRRPAVLAGCSLPACGWQRPPSRAAVHRPERGCGDGGEDQRVLGDRRRHGLATGDPGADQLEHVRRVQPRAGRALAGATVAAADMGDPQWFMLAAVGRDDLARRGVDRLRATAQPDRLGTVPDPGQGLGPGVEPSRDQQVADLLLGPRRQRRQIERRRLTEAWEQVGHDVMNCEIAAAVHRPHHPRRVCHAASAIRPRGTPSSGGPRSQVEHQIQASGSLQRRDTNGSGSSRTEVVSSCLVCGAACLASGHGGEPTPGDLPH